MNLTRRDAAAALVALGATGGVALGARHALRAGDDRPGSDENMASDGQVRTALTAVAAVVYPAEVTGIGPFVDGFLDARLDRASHAAGLRETVAELESLAAVWHGSPIAELSPRDRDRLLREVGADTAEEDPDGTTAERVRYYVVNELLMALYASPKGGELIGIENPPGYPGGATTYTFGPS